MKTNRLLDKKISFLVKYFLSIMVMISHLLPNDTNFFLKLIFNGTLWVSIFMFYTGYGFVYNYYNQKNYLKNHIKKKFKTIWLPYALANVIYYLLLIFLKQENLGITNFLLVCLGLKISNQVLWYMVEVFILNIIAYFIFLFAKEKKEFFLSVFILITMVILVFIDAPNWWYLSLISYIIGIIYFKIEISILLKKINIFVFVSLLILNYFLLTNNNMFSINVNYVLTLIYILESISIILVFDLILNKIKFDKIYKRIEKYKLIISSSEYIYLYHCCVKLVVSNYFDVNFIVFIFEIFVTVIISYIIVYFKNWRNKNEGSCVYNSARL